MSGFPDLGRLVDAFRGDPPTLRWLAFQVDGRSDDYASDNEVAWSTAHSMWVQARLMRAVYRLVSPVAGECWTPIACQAGDQGMVIASQIENGPINRVVTRMLAELGVPRAVRGPVAWLGDRHPDTGLYGDLDDARREALVVLAERCRRDDSGGAGSDER